MPLFSNLAAQLSRLTGAPPDGAALFALPAGVEAPALRSDSPSAMSDGVTPGDDPRAASAAKRTRAGSARGGRRRERGDARLDRLSHMVTGAPPAHVRQAWAQRRGRSASLSALDMLTDATMAASVPRRRGSFAGPPMQAPVDYAVPPASTLRAKPADEGKSRLKYAQLRQLLQAANASSVSAAADAADAYLAQPQSELLTLGVTTAIECLQRAQPTLHTAERALATYEAMLQHGPPPDQYTFAAVVQVLCLGASDSRACDSARTERMFVQAMQLANTAHALHLTFPTTTPYNALLRCCAVRGNTTQAVSVLELLERNVTVKPDAESYRYMIQAFVHDAGMAATPEAREAQDRRRFAACTRVFGMFEYAAAAATVQPERDDSWSAPRRAAVWAAMLDAHFRLNDAAGAVALFERMIPAEGARGARPPPVDEQVSSTMVDGFVRSGEYRVAIEWLSQLQAAQLAMPSAAALQHMVAAILLRAPGESVPLLHKFAATVARWLAAADKAGAGLQPALEAAFPSVGGLATALQAPPVLAAQPPLAADAGSALSTLCALLTQVLDVLVRGGRTLCTPDEAGCIGAVIRLTAQLTALGRAEDAARFFAQIARSVTLADATSPLGVPVVRDACHLPMAIADAAASTQHETRDPSEACARFGAMATLVAPAVAGASCPLSDTCDAALGRLYEAASRSLHGRLDALPLRTEHWQHVLDAFCALERTTLRADLEHARLFGIGKLLDELSRMRERPQLQLDAAAALLSDKYGDEGVQALHKWQRAGERQEPKGEAPRAAGGADAGAAGAAGGAPAASTEGRHAKHLPRVRELDANLSSTIHRLARPQGQLQAGPLYDRMMQRVAQGAYPNPSALAVFLNAFGRTGNTARIDEVYELAMHVIASRPRDSEWQRRSWVQLEDGMVTALSHAGLGTRANMHRERIIAAGQVPSASAYAALIATIQERTDDAAVAEQLFAESQQLQVRPTTYLFNTVISKLSRARKAEQALQLFDAMQDAHVRPTSVTYGAAINACVRTGDEARAVQLFAEMESQQSFQPRVPPYNTMIQYYVHSRPDREKALHYFSKMQDAGVRPSEHTYKLLLDVWGTIEPVEPERQEAVFAKLVADRLLRVQGTHWASLIHTRGVVLRNLDAAIETFESIAENAPVARTGPNPVPDAVVYEALFSVFVAHGRTDLMPAYITRMLGQNILPTAYVANLLIKGYAQDGPLGLVEARRVFDAMQDPPAGYAAVGNHLPRHYGAGAIGPKRERTFPNGLSNAVDRANVLGAMVFREPSTYEAMIRAELLHGNTRQALAVLERMKARAFPAALIGRARAMFDEPSVAGAGRG